MDLMTQNNSCISPLNSVGRKSGLEWVGRNCSKGWNLGVWWLFFLENGREDPFSNLSLLVLNSLSLQLQEVSLPSLSVSRDSLSPDLSFLTMTPMSSPATEWTIDSCLFVFSFSTVCLTWARECSLFWRASVVIRPVQWRKISHYKVFSLNSTFRGLIARQHSHRPRGLWCGYHLLLCLSRWQFKSTQELVLCVFLLSRLWDFFLFVCILDMLDYGIKCFFVYTIQAQNCLLLSFSLSLFF